jgi:hypothetical protein
MVIVRISLTTGRRRVRNRVRSRARPASADVGLGTVLVDQK